MCRQSFFFVLLFAEFIHVAVSGPLPNTTQVPQQNASKAFAYTINPETLEELLNTDKAIVEGDLEMDLNRIAVRSSWPTKEIPYIIAAELESRTGEIVAAMAILSERTCVSFHLRTTERNYLLFKLGKGCTSYLGCIGGAQPIFLAPRCGVGSIIHEILHALGFHHEHTRQDREQYVRVLHHNIMEGKEKNFHIVHGNTFNLPYDLLSIMHYGNSFFSKNGQPTLLALDKTKNIGQRDMMTEMDVERVRRHYNCDKVDEKPREESTTPASQSTRLHHETATTRGKHSSAGVTNRP